MSSFLAIVPYNRIRYIHTFLHRIKRGKDRGLKISSFNRQFCISEAVKSVVYCICRVRNSMCYQIMMYSTMNKQLLAAHLFCFCSALIKHQSNLIIVQFYGENLAHEVTHPGDDEFPTHTLHVGLDLAGNVELVAVEGDTLQIRHQVLLTGRVWALEERNGRL